VTVHEVCWYNNGSEPADDYAFFYGNGNANQHLRTGFSLYKGITSPVKRVTFISGRMSYIILRGPLCDIIVLNVHAPSNQLTAWSKVLLEKPVFTQLVKKFPAFYGTCRFITMLTRACHWSLS
jgi:hypothetical protein